MTDTNTEEQKQHLAELAEDQSAPLETFYVIRALAERIAELEAVSQELLAKARSHVNESYHAGTLYATLELSEFDKLYALLSHNEETK